MVIHAITLQAITIQVSKPPTGILVTELGTDDGVETGETLVQFMGEGAGHGQRRSLDCGEGYEIGGTTPRRHSRRIASP